MIKLTGIPLWLETAENCICVLHINTFRYNFLRDFLKSSDMKRRRIKKKKNVILEVNIFLKNNEYIKKIF